MIPSLLRHVRAAASHDARSPGDGRHAVPLRRLLREKDRRFRPSRELVEIMKTEPWPGYRGFGEKFQVGQMELDRPLVPLLNALIERGFRPRSSCVGAYLAIEGTSECEVQVLTESVIRRLPGATLDWGVSESVPRGDTTVLWRHASVAGDAALDAALLGAADDVRSMEIITRPTRIRPEGALALEIREHLLATNTEAATFVLVGPDTRWDKDSGYRAKTDRPPLADGGIPLGVDLSGEVVYASTLQELKAQFIPPANQLA